MVKHNNIIPGHMERKKWERRVRTTLDQPARAQRRRQARAAKVAKSTRPTGLLRPAVHCPTAKYNMRIRAGRGFTLEELAEAGLNRAVARTIGVSVDHRRKNKSKESLDANVARLKDYLSRIVWDTRTAAGKAAIEGKKTLGAVDVSKTFPVKPAEGSTSFVEVTDAMKSRRAYLAIRELHTEPKLAHVRKVKAEEKAEKAKAKSKKR